MQIVLNGKPTRLDGPATVADFLRHLEVEPARVAVEINEDLVSRKTFARTLIHDGDCIEIVTFVGGG